MNILKRALFFCSLASFLFLPSCKGYEFESEFNFQLEIDGSNNDADREEVDLECAHTIEILSKRLEISDCYVVASQSFGEENRINLQVKHDLEPSDLLRLLTETGKFEFMETASNSHGRKELEMINEVILKTQLSGTEIDSLKAIMDDFESDEGALQRAFDQLNPVLRKVELFRVESGTLDENYPLLGYMSVTDTHAFNAWLRHPLVRQNRSRNVSFAWSYRPVRGESDMLELIGLKPNPDGGSILGNQEIEECSLDSDEIGNPSINITMNASGAKIWQQMTAVNIDRHIAMVLDGRVLTYPRVNSPITGGHTQITGDFSDAEASQIAAWVATMPLSVKLILIE